MEQQHQVPDPDNQTNNEPGVEDTPKKHDKKRRIIIAGGLTALVLIASIVALLRGDSPKSQIAVNGLTFNVRIPQNTPPEDTVYIYLSNQKHYEMQKTGDYTYSLNLSEDKIGPLEENNTVLYRYSRNGQDFNTAEYLKPDTNEFFWTKKGRSVSFAEGKVVNDTIKRWRWFPANGEINRASSLSPSGAFLPRIGGRQFLSGQIIEDLYNESFRPFFATTAKHLKQVGYKSVEIDPPQQLVEENGLPVVKNLIKQGNPNYPDDKTLKEEILAYKQQGLKVVMGPQLCCEAVDFASKDQAWMDAYFAAVTKFLAHHAKIAQETKVDYFYYAIGKEYENADYASRWQGVFKAIRKQFKGKVGEMVWNLGTTPGEIIPDAEYITWGKELDFFYIAIDVPISQKDNPTDSELKQGAATMLDGAKQLYLRYGKPVMVRTTYFNVEKTWKGSAFYDISSVPGNNEPESAVKKKGYQYGGQDLARVVDAYFRAMAERPWVIGYSQFGYAHWENPVSPELSVRGKPAEDIWTKWNQLIYRD